MNNASPLAIELVKAIANCTSHKELDGVANAVKAARPHLSTEEFARVVHHGEDHRDALETAADMWQDLSMPESPYYAGGWA